MSPAQRPGPLVLCILDGWGLAAAGPDNAILSARTPIWRSMLQDCAATSLETSGEAVGLPCGQMGNSEVGHLTMGAGRIFMQDLPRIDHAVSDGSIADCPAFQNLVADLKQSGGRCHLMGLLSPGGVHSHENHMAALANLLANEGIAVLVHAFLDGRDTPPSSARDDMARFVAASPQATVATVTGRYYAMDRDNRWERVERAYDAIVAARGTSTAPHADAAITNAYGAGQTDEFVKPVVIDGYDGMKAGDGLLMANFRADRARQIL
ncbi:MAG: 2,3-bisphosphoglycerate-independent phosphoglycerate mutase, partial [Rhodospirillaceae bacterium]|nr:2,3-bisphosphoglycerate-independent phosphoglycerate mutase [Rhodospirillaceae bacterium]